MSPNSRTLAREYAFKFLYHLQLPQFQDLKLSTKGGPPSDQSLPKILQQFDKSYRELDPEHPDNISTSQIRKLAEPLIQGVIEHIDEIEKRVEALLTNWKMKNIDKVAQTVLFLSTFELLYMKETPIKVVINEAVNLAKKFGPIDSFAFVNGILDNMAKSMSKE
jgi:transcription antitermination protein NusB